MTAALGGDVTDGGGRERYAALLAAETAADLARRGALTGDFDTPDFASGGIVPGPIGMPQLATVHGGETVIPVDGSGGDTFNISISSDMTAPDAAERLVRDLVPMLDDFRDRTAR